MATRSCKRRTLRFLSTSTCSRICATKPDLAFSYMGAIGRMPVALVVHPAFPATTLAEFIAKAKASATAIAYAYLGLVGPADMPPAVVQTLNAALANARQAPRTAERLAELGVEVTPGTPAQFRSHARSESARWGELIRSLGLRIE